MGRTRRPRVPKRLVSASSTTLRGGNAGGVHGDIGNAGVLHQLVQLGDLAVQFVHLLQSLLELGGAVFDIGQLARGGWAGVAVNRAHEAVDLLVHRRGRVRRGSPGAAGPGGYPSTTASGGALKGAENGLD